MRPSFLPFVAAMTVSNAPAVDEPAPRPIAIPAEYLPCSGTVPVFNPEVCPQPALTVGEAKSQMQDQSPHVPSNCGDRIERVREELDQPKLQREPASPDKPLLVAAVDKRIDGCAVLQMHNDINDLRPLPSGPSGPPRLQPAN